MSAESTDEALASDPKVPVEEDAKAVIETKPSGTKSDAPSIDVVEEETELDMPDSARAAMAAADKEKSTDVNGADDASGTEPQPEARSLVEADTEVDAKIVLASKEPEPSTQGGEVRLRLFGRTDVGQVRGHNEDNFIVADLTKASRGLMENDRTQTVGERGTVLGVCDGMGGAAAGEVASQLAVDIVYEHMLRGDPPRDRDDLAGRLVDAIETAGLRIFSEAKADRALRGMGTTSTIAALIDDHLFLGQVGDSRGYILRGGRLVQATRDQSLVNQLIEAGQLTEEEAETFEHNNIILQALGTADSVQVDLTYVELRAGDVLLLCSDGLSGMVRNDEIREVLSSIEDPLEACRELTDRANQAGGHDNVTVVIARFEGDGLKEPTPEDIQDLRYRKYELPDGVYSARSERNGSAAPPPKMQSLRPNKSGKMQKPSIFDERSDEDEDTLAEADPVELPKEGAPSWIVTMIIVSAVTCVVVLGYYLLR